MLRTFWACGAAKPTSATCNGINGERGEDDRERRPELKNRDGGGTTSCSGWRAVYRWSKRQRLTRSGHAKTYRTVNQSSQSLPDVLRTKVELSNEARLGRSRAFRRATTKHSLDVAGTKSSTAKVFIPPPAALPLTALTSWPSLPPNVLGVQT